ncbi:MAG: amino acid carrier protein [Acidobacteria bacterium]|nr:amino acid carrier protein [Acidobacteriota bacterium]MDA1235281.1 amino acid carrier protein [Acidobacteriota bacterium]
MESIAQSLSAFSAFAWGPWLVALLLGGGAYFFVYSRFLPFRYFPHAIDLLRGKYDDPDAPGELSHFRALASALAGTIGLGNIGGVAVAIHTGGPGAIFWMWMGAFLGIATKFFTCTLAVLYRGKDSRGDLQGGPMYVIVQGLGPRWRPLAVFFCLCSLVGVLPLFQANQLVQVIRDVLIEPNGLATDPTSLLYFSLSLGVVTAAVVGLVVIGGIQRIGAATSRLVPLMVLLYVGMAVWILATNVADIPSYFALIFQDAFTGDAVLGGSIGSVIRIGVQRSAFSNEAGIGTEAMAHGAARTREPVREGLVAMLGPAIDTLIVCTATAIIILSSGVWKTSDANGVTLTAEALSEHLPGLGPYLLVICVFFFGVSTMFSYNYYGVKSLSFIVGAERAHLYNYFYLPSIIVASVVTVSSVVDLIDGMFALMAIPTMTSALLLSPKVMKAARAYFQKFDQDKTIPQ